MSKYPLPNTVMPKTSSRSGLPPGRPAADAVQSMPPARPPEPFAPVLRRTAKGVYSMFKRLRSSYLRSSSVRDARMDAALNGDQGYLLLHYFHSVK